LLPFPNSNFKLSCEITNWYSEQILELHQINHGHFTRFRKHLGAMDLTVKLTLNFIKSVWETVLDIQASLMTRIDSMEK